MKKWMVVLAVVSVGSILWLQGGDKAGTAPTANNPTQAFACPMAAGVSCASAQPSQACPMKASYAPQSGCCAQAQAKSTANLKPGAMGLVKSSGVQKVGAQTVDKAAVGCPMAQVDCPMAEDCDECLGCCGSSPTAVKATVTAKDGQCPFLKTEAAKNTVKNPTATTPSASQTAAK
jgi:hypothetical protein